MQMLGISQYPSHHRRLVWHMGVLTILIACEGAGTLLWLTLQPSDPGSRAFLHFSPQRWALLFLTLAGILAVLSLLGVIKFKSRLVNNWLGIITQFENARWIFFSFTTLFLATVGIFAWLPHVESLEIIYKRLLPILIWATVAVTQVWLFLVVSMRNPISRVLKEIFPTDSEKRVFPVAKGKLVLPFLFGATLLYLFLQYYAWARVPAANIFADSESYLYGARLSLGDPAFFSERRPWGILLIYKSFGGSLPAINLFQVVMSAFAWIWLAWTFTGSIRDQWGKVFGLIAILGFSLSPAIQVWNHAVLSESLSISGTVIILTLFLRLSQEWKWRIFILLILCFILWMSVRESHSYLGLLVASILLALSMFRRTLRVYWWLSFCIGVTFVINSQLSAAYGLPRWAFPMAEVITMRILPKQDYLAYFSENGMPVSPELMALSGRWATSDDYAIVNDLRLKKFSRWLFRDSQEVYIKFLLSHPEYAIEAPLENIKQLLAADYFSVIPIDHYIPALPTLINEALYPLRWFWLYLWLSLFAAGFISASHINYRIELYWLIITFLLLSIPHMYLVWHGDALDVERHAVLANIQWRLGFLMMFILYIDNRIQHRNSHLSSKRLASGT